VTDAAYWTRPLARLWVHGTRVRLTYTSRDGTQKTWTGKLISVEDAKEEAS
jgi:hypothetical protein